MGSCCARPSRGGARSVRHAARPDVRCRRHLDAGQPSLSATGGDRLRARRKDPRGSGRSLRQAPGHRGALRRRRSARPDVRRGRVRDALSARRSPVFRGTRGPARRQEPHRGLQREHADAGPARISTARPIRLLDWVGTPPRRQTGPTGGRPLRCSRTVRFSSPGPRTSTPAGPCFSPSTIATACSTRPSDREAR